MSKLNLLVSIGTYSDKRASNSPNLSNFKWVRQINGISAEDPISLTTTLASEETQVLFTGVGTKKLIYLECSAEITFKVNGGTSETLKPIIINDSTFPGILLRTSDITSLEVTNPSGDSEVTIFLAAVE